MAGPEGPANFYPRSPRGERPIHKCQFIPVKQISIHAPRVGSDFKLLAKRFCNTLISIHAPRVGSDGVCGEKTLGKRRFLSTLPAWGATCCPPGSFRLMQANFYPRSPRGERRTGSGSRSHRQPFLSTLPAWGATMGTAPSATELIFLSTLPAWGATPFCDAGNCSTAHFYPRSPRGERPPAATAALIPVDFYPRSPRGERPRTLG